MSISLAISPDDDANAEDITTGAKNGLKLADLRGVDYNDEKWDQLLDQMSIEDMQQIIGFGGYQTEVRLPS